MEAVLTNGVDNIYSFNKLGWREYCFSTITCFTL